MNEKYIKRCFSIAARLARKSTHHQHKLGCVIVNKNRFVGFGYNQLKTHTKSKHKFGMIHAEFDAILGADPADLKNSTVFVYRETKKGLVGLAKPCEVCHDMLHSVGIRDVYYTTECGIEYYSIDKNTKD